MLARGCMVEQMDKLVRAGDGRANDRGGSERRSEHTWPDDDARQGQVMYERDFSHRPRSYSVPLIRTRAPLPYRHYLGLRGWRNVGERTIMSKALGITAVVATLIAARGQGILDCHGARPSRTRKHPLNQLRRRRALELLAGCGVEGCTAGARIHDRAD